MPKIVIVGGKLQGGEVAYLGREAGFEIVLIDKDPDAPSQNLCTKFICGDVLSDNPEIVRELESADMILPTMENAEVLYELTLMSEKRGYVLAFDWEAYKISSSKKRSDRLFADNGLPCPRYYPEGQLPYIAKPDSESGSHGVQYFDTNEKFECFLENGGDKYVIQEFVEGPSYSMEIIGVPGNYRTYELTEIFVDDVYDCNLAATLRTLENDKQKKIEELIVNIAELINLRGIMDIEVIDHNGEIKILEIDARFPSQTPIVVYHASGMNYVEELYELFCKGNFMNEQINTGKCASITHYLFDGKDFLSHGEHIMVEGRKLCYTEGICSSAIVISDYCHDMTPWRGTFINSADNIEELKKEETKMINELKNMLGNM